ncbi:flocculation protein FLO11-like isoform X2 [Amphibalanus amphitrite]|uniref:flocculation protein FLO11-like isoform X1 n=1 Tax=Amphibalanus amphitrite TaxID=1232801 RepID=UPI001C9003DC|nr:flocculation protein FLO11-like isoform X1 [Amphibalanus amphitrite]XP_043217923.1 flocculation protein FLO11-like isoform X2 [Amphibalanus amphitrite]
MTPAQVCVLLAVLLGGGTGAPLARAAPAPAPGRVLHQMIADRLGGVPATPAASAAPERPPPPGDSREPRQYGETGDYDYYYVYEYDDLPPEDADVSTAEVGQAAAVAPTESSAAATDAAPARASPSPTPEEQAVSSVTVRSTEPSASPEYGLEPELESESTVRPDLTSSTIRTSHTNVPTAASSSPTPKEQRKEQKGVVSHPVSEHSLDESRIYLEEVEYATTSAELTTTESSQTRTPSSSTIAPSSTTASPSSTTTSSTTTSTPSPTTTSSSTLKPPSTASPSANKKQPYTRSKPASGDTFHDQLNEVRQGHSEVNEIDLEHQAAGGFQQSTAPFEQQGSSSDKVLAYQLRAANLDEPRETPEFFVPPIVRRPYRRRVSLTGGGRRSNAPSLGDRLAEQVRRQLEELERREQAETGYRHPFIPSPPTTSERPYRHPFIPSPPTTTEKPYKHPFIPTPPSTTEKPYKPPFIPTPPSTTEKPYRPPFIPTAPSTTSRPYQHPFIPSAPTPTPQPYRHPFIPVPPSATERPQARRIGGDAGRAQATIVHEETLEAGFIVGEYGVVHGGGTVRGVKYAADSSVDRRLLEEALAHFLRL